MNLEQTIAHWRQLCAAAAAGNSTHMPRGLYRPESGGYRLAGMQVDAEALDELLEIAARKEQVTQQYQQLQREVAQLKTKTK